MLAASRSPGLAIIKRAIINANGSATTRHFNSHTAFRRAVAGVGDSSGPDEIAAIVLATRAILAAVAVGAVVAAVARLVVPAAVSAVAVVSVAVPVAVAAALTRVLAGAVVTVVTEFAPSDCFGPAVSSGW